jgi:hypothetical protein
MVRYCLQVGKINRSEEKIPHPSFDLNGDGIVSQHEYAVAKMFDEDRDGILNKQEKAKCLEALKNGFENTFYWCEDMNDPAWSFRIIQKDGKIYMPDRIFNENNGSKVDRFGKTQTFLQDQRK